MNSLHELGAWNELMGSHALELVGEYLQWASKLLFNKILMILTFLSNKIANHNIRNRTKEKFYKKILQKKVNPFRTKKKKNEGKLLGETVFCCLKCLRVWIGMKLEIG